MAVRKEIEVAVQFKEFQRTVEKLLTPEDKDFLFYAMKEYNTYKSVAKLMLALNSCLDTPTKLDLLPYIRDLIPKHDRKRFDNLAPYNRMAHPFQAGPHVGVSPGSTEEKLGTRVVNLQRKRESALGFSIRGGQEHELGIYISHVESLSQAEKAGLRVGDRLIRVNGIDFERVSHGSAVLVLKSHDNLKIEVKNTGKIPGEAPSRNSFHWVDVHGRSVDEISGKPKRARHSISREDGSSDRLLSSPDKHKIVLHSSKKRSLGFSIRGGSEYGLGVYISVVDSGSLSEEAGLKVGDQILDINGHSFLSILHFEAVHILRSYKTLIMTIKSLGRIPTLQENQDDDVTLEQSPITRRKSAEFLKSNSPRRSKRPSSATIEEEEEPEPEPEDEPTSRPTSSNLKRSESERQRSSVPGSNDETDHPRRTRSNSFGSGSLPPLNFSQRPSSGILKKKMVLSPLATHDTRASVSSSSPLSSPESGHSLVRKSKFFEKGLGTQVMLANISSQAKQLLFDKARRVLTEEGVEILREDLVQYEETGDINQFVDCLISIFNSPEKMELLRDIRSVVKPTDIVRFDEKVSPHELRAFRERPLGYDSDDDDFDHDVIDINEDTFNDTIELTGIQEQNGHIRPFTGEREKSASLTFGVPTMSPSLVSNQSPSMSSPELSVVQTKEMRFSMEVEQPIPSPNSSRSSSSISSSSSNNKGNISNGTSTRSENNNNSTNNTGRNNIRNTNGNGISNGSSIGSGISNGISRSSNYNNNNSIERHSQFPGSHLISPPQGNPVIVNVNKEAPYIGLAIRTVTHDNYVLVKDVRPGGAIHRDGFIQPGFEIIQVDNIRIRGKSYHNAAREIADAFKSEGPTVQFIVIPNYD